MDSRVPEIRKHLKKKLDAYRYEHTLGVMYTAGSLAMAYGYDYEKAMIAGLLHDIGKLEMAKYVYQKGQKPLTIEEIKYVRLHPTLGYAITSQNHYSDFIIKSILYHHENYDGSGFQSNLKEDEIPIGARILRICDVFAALISDRQYRRAFSWEKAVAIMIEEIKNFDLKLFLCFLEIIHDEVICERLRTCEQMKWDLEEDTLWQ